MKNNVSLCYRLAFLLFFSYSLFFLLSLTKPIKFFDTTFTQEITSSNTLGKLQDRKNEGDDVEGHHVAIDVKKWNAEDVKNVSVPLRELMELPVTLSIEQDNKWLINIIRKKYIRPPSELPYNLTQIRSSKEDDPSFWQTKEIYTLFKENRNGVFVECGAHDGENLSNTLLLEKMFGWTGALIEANPVSYLQLISKHRKSWAVSSCLSPNSFPKKMPMMLKSVFSKLTKHNHLRENENVSDVQCFPLYSILLALNLTKVDYFSLDVEGSEYDILKTIPWDKVEITAWSIEFNLIRQGKYALKQFMKSKGYEVYIDGAKKKVNQNIDIIFVKKTFLENIKS